MNIRREEPKDYRECENVTREAFWNVYKPGCAEHYVLHTYRNKPEFVPELDFVLEEDGKIIGHVMFVRAKINADDGREISVMTFGPISILPEYKRKGYGKLWTRQPVWEQEQSAWKETSTFTANQALTLPARAEFTTMQNQEKMSAHTS